MRTYSSGMYTRLAFAVAINVDADILFQIDPMELLPAQYILDIASESGLKTPVDYWKDAARFKVVSPIGDVGIARLEHEWEIGDVVRS